MEEHIQKLIINIGKEIKNERKSRGLKQKEMAERMGIVHQYYSQLEDAQRLKLSFRRYMEMCIVLDIPLNVIVKRAEGNSSNIKSDNHVNRLQFDEIHCLVKHMGVYFKKMRIDNNLSVEDLAAYLDIDQQTYNQLENGVKKGVGMFRFASLAERYDVPLHEIIRNAELQFSKSK